MKHNLTASIITASIIVLNLSTSLEAAVPVIWDGSAGLNTTLHPSFGGMYRWEEANWTKNGTPGQTAQATMGDRTGGNGGVDIVIGGGVTVFHDQNDDTDDVNQGGTGLGLGDFKASMEQFGAGSLTIKEGAVLWLDSHTDIDGRWARPDIHMTLDNGTFRTTHTPAFCPPSECSDVGGRIMIGNGNDLLPNTVLQWNIINGGRIEMEGKMVFGSPDFLDGDASSGHNPGIGMNMTINNGTLDLTGGNLYDDFFGLVNGELVFFYEWNEVAGTPKFEDYRINFTGPGQIILDNGIFAAEQDAADAFNPKGGLAPDLYTSLTYEDLWTLGILRANGLTGIDENGDPSGLLLSNYFSTSGSPGSPNYTLTSLVVPPGQDGDHNKDGVVNAADYVIGRKVPGNFGGDPAWYDDFRENFGEPGAGSGGAVPEPTGLMPVLLGLASLWCSRRKSFR